MLRISITKDANRECWTLQGRLSGPWVAQLKSAWKEARQGGRGKSLVDMNGVTFVDLAGERVLAQMMKDGAEFIATGVYTRHLLETLAKRRMRWIDKFLCCD